MREDSELFARRSLTDWIQARCQNVDSALRSWNPDELLGTPAADVVDELLQMALMDPIGVAEGKLDPPRDATVHVREFDQDFERQTTRHTLVLQIEGDPDLFDAYPRQRWISGGPWGSISSRSRELLLFADGHDPLQIRSTLDAELGKVQRSMSGINSEIEEHNQRMRELIPQEVDQRIEKLRHDRQVLTEIGFPLRRRPDAQDHAIPIIRKSIRPAIPSRRSSQPFAPEWTLLDADYEAALKVLTSARNALERSPSLTATLNEEKIRDLLLFTLNAQFQGAAAGEVFNGAGKTDILIRMEDRNVFIAECKLYRTKNRQSVKRVTNDALKQLLGYLTWRDTKAALIFFIRAPSATSVIDTAINTIKAHPNFKRAGATNSEDRHDFVLHINEDERREIKLALLPFVFSHVD